LHNKEEIIKIKTNFMGQYCLEDYKLSLINFENNMSRYHKFISQNKTIDKRDVISSLDLISSNDNIEENKKIFLRVFANLIISNGYNFDDFLIENDTTYEEGSSEYKSINFELANIRIVDNPESDIVVKEADIKFTLSNNKHIVLQYVYHDNWLEELIKEYPLYIYVNCRDGNKIYKYCTNYYHDNKFRILLNDLFQYLEFIGENYYNIEFSKDAFWGTDDNNTLLKHCSFIDLDWQINDTDIKYAENVDSDILNEIDIKDLLNNDEIEDEYLFNYCYEFYNKRIRYYSNNRINKEAFLIIDILDKLIQNNHPMACILKSLLYLDGKLILKDTSDAKQLLKKAYELGVKNPTLRICNENNLK
jgi:hypothetical protein